MDQNLKNRIEDLLKSNDIILFMKGEKLMPMCGFSNRVVNTLLEYLDSEQFEAYNILSDMEIREGLKDYSDWPTYPQLYIKGELIGGHDIIMEMEESGELEELLNSVK